jgi:hypothetical protein
MSDLPYLCDFRVIIHTWDFEFDRSTQEKIEWEKSQIEILKVETWSQGFNFISKTKRNTDFIMKSRDPASPLRLSKAEYGNDIIRTDDILKSIVDDTIKPSGERFYEIIGKLYEYTHGPNHENEYDSETEVGDIEYQELEESDISWLFKR